MPVDPVQSPCHTSSAGAPTHGDVLVPDTSPAVPGAPGSGHGNTASDTSRRTRPEILLGDATDPVGTGPRIIAHVCNDLGAWGRGFVVAVSARWAKPERRYRRWSQDTDGPLPLGRVQLVAVEPDLWVANMIGQHGIRRVDGVPPIRYEALARCLRTLGESALELGASVHMPRIGCGLAGGTWDRVEPLVVEALCARGVHVTVYELPDDRGGR